MGAIWEVNDVEFDRPMAVKIMLPDVSRDELAVARFFREAEITARLQHPAIPPVVDRGSDETGTPFFSLKLIQGATLDSLLNDRRDPGEELLKYIGIFEQICQAVGFAHSQGIIHRDLKPANIMVGTFGEVQVMDWGMAKLIGDPEPGVTTAKTSSDDVDLTDETELDAEGMILTRAGQVVGTLVYMPPEQARGLIDQIDARADVFALGGILLKILTGHPPFRLKNRAAIYHAAASGELSEAFQRLDQCDADSELVQLCKQCLSASIDGRPHDAWVVAETVSRYQEGVQERLRQEQADRAAAETRATEEQKRAVIERGKKRAVMFSTIAVALLVTGGTAAAIWYQNDQANRRVEAARREGRQQERESRSRETTVGILKDIPGLLAKYQYSAAERLLSSAANGVKTLDDPGQLAVQIEQARKDVAVARALDQIELQMGTWSNGGFEREFALGRDGAFASAFRDYGLSILNSTPEVLGRVIRESNVRQQLIGGLDRWAVEENDPRRRQIWAIARSADDNEARNRLRDVSAWSRGKVPEELLEALDLEETSSSFVTAIVILLLERSRESTAERLLSQCRFFHPDDFWISFHLSQLTILSLESRLAHGQSALGIRPQNTATLTNQAQLLSELRRFEEAEQFLRRALKIDPKQEVARHNLGVVLTNLKRYDEAEHAYKRVLQNDPKSAIALASLGDLERERKRFGTAEKTLRRALKLDPRRKSAHTSLGRLFFEVGRYDQAEQVFRHAVKLWPTDPDLGTNLGYLFARMKRFDEAEEAYRKVLKIHPESHDTHNKLGLLMQNRGRYREAEREYRRVIEINPDTVIARSNLGNLLTTLKRYDEAERHLRKSLAINPRHTKSMLNLGLLLRIRNRYDDAMQQFRRATQVAPKYAKAHYHLGSLLHHLKRYKEAEVAYRNALSFDQKHANTHYKLANLQFQFRRFREAENSYRRAIQLDPQHAEAHCNFGSLLMDVGRFEESVVVLRKGHQLGMARKNWRYKSKEALDRAVNLSKLDRELTAIREGGKVPQNAMRLLTLGGFAFLRKNEGRLAVRLLEDSLKDPLLNPSYRLTISYVAARAALSVAQGKAVSESNPPSIQERIHHRSKAYRWLNAIRLRWRIGLQKDPSIRMAAVKEFQGWLIQPDFDVVVGEGHQHNRRLIRRGLREYRFEIVTKCGDGLDGVAVIEQFVVGRPQAGLNGKRRSPDQRRLCFQALQERLVPADVCVIVAVVVGGTAVHADIVDSVVDDDQVEMSVAKSLKFLHAVAGRVRGARHIVHPQPIAVTRPQPGFEFAAGLFQNRRAEQQHGIGLVAADGIGIDGPRMPEFGIVHPPDIVDVGTARDRHTEPKVLADGGNAFDAALTAAAVQFLVDPHSCGIGGYLVMTCHPAGSTEPGNIIDAPALAGSRTSADMWKDIVIGPNPRGWGYFLKEKVNEDGFQAICTPGYIRGMQAIVDRWCTRSWSEILQPAISIAHNGWVVTEHPANRWKAPPLYYEASSALQKINVTEAGRQIYLKPDGSTYEAGETLRNPDYGRSLERLANHGPDDFYTGELAAEMIADIAAHQGWVTADDLANYQIRDEPPVVSTYRGYTIVSNPAPHGGPTLAAILNILELDDLASIPHNSPEYILRVSLAMKAAFADRNRHLADPAFEDVPVDWMTSKERAAEWREAIAAGTPIETGRMHQDSPDTTQGRVANAASLLCNGRVEATIQKTLLPNYDVFDERRYFRPAVIRRPMVFRGRTLGVHICEDAWWGQPDTFHHHDPQPQSDPIIELMAGGCDLLINLSASPFEVNKPDRRAGILAAHVARHGVPFLFVNQVGGNDDLVFDGRSLAFDGNGNLVAQLAGFREDTAMIDLPAMPPATTTETASREADILDALILGLGDYMRKCGFSDCVLGLSGGIDSAVAAYIAARALGPEHVHGLLMPSRYSSPHSIADSEALATNLGIDHATIAIDDIHQAYERADVVGADLAQQPTGLADQNLQARIRGACVMIRSNQYGWMALATGNKSELAVGYCTLYGDMAGGFAVLSDVLKRDVYAIARYANTVREGREVIPENIITKAPSAELAPDQFDQDVLPPYDVLDAILEGLIEREESVATIAESYPLETVQWVAKRLDRNEFKRRQMPPGIKLSTRAFGSGRRMPMAAKTDQT
eukprot:g32991.t1